MINKREHKIFVGIHVFEGGAVSYLGKTELEVKEKFYKEQIEFDTNLSDEELEERINTEDKLDEIIEEYFGDTGEGDGDTFKIELDFIKL